MHSRTFLKVIEVSTVFVSTVVPDSTLLLSATTLGAATICNAISQMPSVKLQILQAILNVKLAASSSSLLLSAIMLNGGAEPGDSQNRLI